MKRLYIAATLVALACTPSGESKKIAQNEKTGSRIKNAKVSSQINTVVKKLHSRVQAGESIKGFTTHSSSNSRVRIDEQGNIQCYLYLKNSEDSTLTELKPRLKKIDIINKELNIVQAWVPFEAVEKIAGLDFVTRITQPDYGIKMRH
ncbi:MAG: hypothetical protein ACE5IR_04495 [bacterium]